jgi:ribose/xylose/arabinose/galactoside ABC-type transport system permease subunit
MPVGAVFFYLALLTGNRDLERAAFFVLVAVLLTTPVAGVTGFFDWKRRYGGRKVPIFHRKIGLALGLFALASAGAVLRALNPTLFERGGGPLFVYALIVTATLPLLVLLGHWGGKLVFEWRKFPEANPRGSEP